jgi:polyisoprenoid-binding protein YceI
MNHRLRVLVVCVVVASGGAAAGQGGRTFAVDAAASRMTVEVGRAGLFAFAGHDHEVAVPAVTGTVVLDTAGATRSSVTLEFDAGALTVTGRGEPAADVPEVQRVMLSERVLDAERYPSIGFASRRVAVLDQSPDRLSLRIEGELTLRDVTRTVTVAVDVAVSGDRLTATGRTAIRQTDFGIRPVTAAAGTVRVKDELDILFSIVAVSAAPAPPGD